MASADTYTLYKWVLEFKVVRSLNIWINEQIILKYCLYFVFFGQSIVWIVDGEKPFHTTTKFCTKIKAIFPTVYYFEQLQLNDYCFSCSEWLPWGVSGYWSNSMPVFPACCIGAVSIICLICSVIDQAVTAADSISDSGTDSESINIDQDSTGVDESLNEALRELDELVSLSLCLIS